MLALRNVLQDAYAPDVRPASVGDLLHEFTHVAQFSIRPDDPILALVRAGRVLLGNVEKSFPIIRVDFWQFDTKGRASDTPVKDVRVRRAIAHAIDRNKIVGAVCIYLLLGLIWAEIYLLIAGVNASAIHGISPGPRYESYAELVYFSFVSLTTLGFGDISPDVG